MAKVALIALALAGCNQVYGLDQTRLDDAPGPVRCTDAAPRFRGTPVLIIPGSTAIRYYSISADRSLAVAHGAGNYYEGPGDSAALKGASLSPPPPATMTPPSPRLAPEGDEVFIPYQSSFDRYKPGDWTRQAQIPVVAIGISAPTARVHGPRHMLVLPSFSELREYVETAPDQWQQVGDPYTPKELGLSSFIDVNMTSDGLHLTIGNQSVIGYASRAQLSDRFTKPLSFNPFFADPVLHDPQVTADCARLYFIVPTQATAGVYYVETE